MENNPVEPVIIPPSTPPLPLTVEQKPSRAPWLIFIFLLVFGAAAYLGHPYFLRLYQDTLDNPTLPQTSPLSSSQSRSAYPPIAGTDKKLVYLRQPKPEMPGLYEAWMIDPTTGVEEMLPIKNFTQAYKYYGSTKIIYRPVGQEAEYRILDLSTGNEVSHKLITHPDPTAHESANMDNIRMISPDLKHLVFQVDFFKPCPSPSPLPSNFQGGFGPCTPEESLETPYGYYLYDLEKRVSTYLGDFIRVSRWDIANHKLYYVNETVTKALDLQTKSIATIDATSHFGYFTYPLLASKQLVSQEGATNNNGQAAFSKISLIDIESKKTITIDQADDWGVIQPFLDSSPDDQNIIYVRTNLLSNHVRRFDLFKYNLSEKVPTRLTPDDSKLSYRYYGDWIDNHTFVTTVDTIEETGYTNTNNYMVKIDITTGKITRLTPHEKVYSFNTQ